MAHTPQPKNFLVGHGVQNKYLLFHGSSECRCTTDIDIATYHGKNVITGTIVPEGKGKRKKIKLFSIGLSLSLKMGYLNEFNSDFKKK
jgi:hypothetical protein